MWFCAILWMQAGFPIRCHPATVPVSLNRLLKLTFCQHCWPWPSPKKKKSDIVRVKTKWQHSFQKCSVPSPPAWSPQLSLAVSTGDSQALLYSQGHISGWWVGLSSPNIQNLLLNLHLWFQRGGGEEKSISEFLYVETGAARRVCMCTSADAKLWAWIWKVLSKVPASSSRSKHNLALYVHGARSFSVVVERAWRNDQKKSSALRCGK